MATLANNLLDKRIVERNIAKGLISKEQYEQHVAELADRADGCERVEVDPGDVEDSSPRE